MILASEHKLADRQDKKSGNLKVSFFPPKKSLNKRSVTENLWSLYPILIALFYLFNCYFIFFVSSIVFYKKCFHHIFNILNPFLLRRAHISALNLC